jgi:hypothetical protein
MRIRPNNNEIAEGVKAWFATLNDQDKQAFLATTCIYLTTFARQSTKIEELQGLNELQDCLYQAIATISARRLTFSAEELWQSLNLLTKQYRLDTVLWESFDRSKELMESGAVNAKTDVHQMMADPIPRSQASNHKSD